MFIRTPLLFALILSFATVASADTKEEAIVKADAMIAELGTGLKTRLVEAMKAGGPATAIPVCKEIGQTMADDMSRKQGARIHRVSLKTRNSANIPNGLEAHLLGQMNDDKAAGALKPSYQSMFMREGKTYLLYMKPVVTAKVCLNCHGPAEGLAPAVKEALAGAYPDDRATGYAEGDVRGAFSVAAPL